MKDGARLDGRREKALRAEMLRRAAAMLGGDGQERPAGEIASAIIGVAARIEEEVTRRLDRVPDKQTDNFFNAMRIGRDPARPAHVPVAFKLADPAPEGLVAPASTRLMASGDTGSVIFETDRAVALAPGSIAALLGVDAAADRIYHPPAGVVGASLPREPAVARTLRSPAGAGEDKLQISLATDLASGTILRIGTEPGAPEHRIANIEGDLVTVEPRLERTFDANTPVAVVTDFAPFAGHRDQQSHTLYLGHETLLNVPSKLGITVTGVVLPPETNWSWWGQMGEDPPAWHGLIPVATGNRLTLRKEAGQPVKAAIGGRETLWLRARLPGPSGQSVPARDIRLSLAGEGACAKPHAERCSEAGDAMAVKYEAIANTTPVVPSSPFHPFGREPRLFDSFYIGSAEAFSKPGAEVSLCFKFAGPGLGPLAMVAAAGLVQVFGVGADGLLYRAQFGNDQPRLLPIALRRDQIGGTALAPHSPVAARLFEERVLVAIAGQGTVYFADLPFKEPLDPAAIEWKSLISEDHRSVAIGQIAIVEEGNKPVVLAQAGASVLSWTDPKGASKLDVSARQQQLVPLLGVEAALLIDSVVTGGDRNITLRGLGNVWTHGVRDALLPAFDRAAWAAPPATKGALPAFMFIAGYQAGNDMSELRVVRIATAAAAGARAEAIPGPKAADLPGEPQAGKRWPIAFQPPPAGAPPPNGVGDVPPTIVLASTTPARFVWHGNGYVRAKSAPSIGPSNNPHRQFVGAPGWIAVHRGRLGLLYRPAGGNGDWADEFVVAAKGERMAVAERVPDDKDKELYAAPDPRPEGNGYEILRSETPLRALLRRRPDLRESTRVPAPPIASFFVDGVIEGTLEVGEKLRLRDDEAYRIWRVEDDKRKNLLEEVGLGEQKLETLTTEKGVADRLASEAERAFRTDEAAAEEARKAAARAVTEASQADGKLREATNAHRQAQTDLDQLRVDREEAGKLADATAARTLAEGQRDRLKEAAKKEADAVAAAQRDLPKKTAAREKAEVDMAGLEAAVEAARLEHEQAEKDFSEGGGNPESKKDREDAEQALKDATTARDNASGGLDTLRAEEAALIAAAAKEPTVTQAMIDSAEGGVADAKRLEEARKAAAAKGVTQKMIDTAEAGVSAEKKKEEEAGTKATAAHERKRLSAEAQTAAERKRDAARVARDARAGEAQGKAGQAGAAREGLDAKQASLRVADAAARSRENYSAAADVPEVVIRVFRKDEAQDPHQIWNLKRSADRQWRDKPAGFPSDLPPVDKILRYRILVREEDRPVAEAVEIRDREKFESRVQELGAAQPLRRAETELARRDEAARAASARFQLALSEMNPAIPAKLEALTNAQRELQQAIDARHQAERELAPLQAEEKAEADAAAALGLRRQASGARLFDAQPDMAVPPIERFTRPAPNQLGEGQRPESEVHAMTAPRELFDPDGALVTTPTEEWRSLGPAQPPNPALSWEYWNGRSWWALDGARLIDATSNLLVDGGLFFVVPDDLEQTEVGGRENHWIRARLVGGDYGEAQVTVKSTMAGDEARQTVERDMTTIRAPYVTSLKLGFCIRTEVAPEIVLTEDSLDMLDQTSANDAGLPVTVFNPLAEVMKGTAPAPPSFARALMIGFEKPVRGDPLSLYVDAAPGEAPGELVAEILRDGRFQMVGIRDETHGLSEPGMIQLSINSAPDGTDLLGVGAYWLRLRPKGDAPSWSPRIRAIHLNAVAARSVETREMESLGHSSGIPDQGFRLGEAPVAPESLELRVRESLGEEDVLAGGLDVLAMARAMPGPWVRWRAVDDLGEAPDAGRGFLLDSETGLVRFGDGRRGAIPPLGAELLAVRYRHVAGKAGNDVAAGAELQLLSPVAGVERVMALDMAAGGSDVETAEAARRRGSSKMRHGDRILTLADLEDYVRARSPTIAQVRAANRGGAVRLVVAGTGAAPRPAPAVLRELERAVRETAGYGVARAGGLSVVPPRLLPVRVEILLEPCDPDRFLEMADAVEAALIALFDPATGGFDGQGWPIGLLPVPGDINAALESVSRLGLVSDIHLLRLDRRPAEPLPASIPADVLARLDPSDIVAERRREKVA